LLTFSGFESWCILRMAVTRGPTSDAKSQILVVRHGMSHDLTGVCQILGVI